MFMNFIRFGFRNRKWTVGCKIVLADSPKLFEVKKSSGVWLNMDKFIMSQVIADCHCIRPGLHLSLTLITYCQM